MTRIKICGLSRPCDVAFVNQAQPDWCGFIIDFPRIHRSVSPRQALAMMRRFADGKPLETLAPVAKAEDVAKAAALTCTCRVSEDVMDYMAALCEAARDPERVRLGPSPRALLALMHACQALAAIRGRDYVIPDDVKELAVPVLAHRVLLRGLNYQQTSGDFIREVLGRVSVPTEDRA